MKSKQPRKQRKLYFNAPLHKRRKMLAAHLTENLLLKYDRRNIPVVKGDTVKVMRGSFRGHEDKVAGVNLKRQVVEIEGITTVKADGTKVARTIHPSNLLITKLNLTDKWRRNKLEKGLSEVTKKEIEKEAEEQIKELEKIEAEEKAKAEELEKETEPIQEEKQKEEPKKATKTEESPKKTEETPKAKTETKKDEVKKGKPTTAKKTEAKKIEKPKSKNVKKTSKKSTKKSEGEK